MEKFKIGDEVLVTNNDGSHCLIPGKIARVMSIDDDTGCYCVLGECILDIGEGKTIHGHFYQMVTDEHISSPGFLPYEGEPIELDTNYEAEN